MLSVIIKHGGVWHFLARIFGMKGNTFEAQMNRFVTLIHNLIYESLLMGFAIDQIYEN